MTRISDVVRTPLFTSVSANLSASRTSGTVYQNTGDTPMFVVVSGKQTVTPLEITAEVGASTPPNFVVVSVESDANFKSSVSFIVPVDYFYEITHNINSGEIWIEIV